MFAGFGDLPQLDPIIAHEVTDDGWRGLTERGEVLTIKGANGHKAEVPEGDLLITRGGKAVGRRAIEQRGFKVDDYLTLYNQASALFRKGKTYEALVESNALMAMAPTFYARFNRAFILLTLGQWTEGLAEYELCERESPFLRPKMRAALEAGIAPWRGEDLAGKRLMLVHDHGFGDTIQMLRYVPKLQAMGAEIVLHVLPELHSIAAQFAPVAGNDDLHVDYCVSFLHLLRWLKVTPDNVTSEPYITVDAALREKWGERLGASKQMRIGVAWSVGVYYKDDYPRALPLDQLLVGVPSDAELFNLQRQTFGDARGTQVFNDLEFDDFADCAALMSLMDIVISVDTAALHLAGAIGHPRVFGLLSYWHSWRWLAPWYGSVKLCRQRVPGDWASALEQIC